jgi:hypothetical protein
MPPAGAVKYLGVFIDKKHAHNPYWARIQLDGKRKSLGRHPTAEAAAHAYDVVARTIGGRKLNFPTGGSSAAAAAWGSSTVLLPASGAGQPSRVTHDDDAPTATAASACARKRKEPSSSSPRRAGAAPQSPARQQHLRQKAHASAQLAGVDEDDVPLNGLAQAGASDFAVASALLAMSAAMRR